MRTAIELMTTLVLLLQLSFFCLAFLLYARLWFAEQSLEKRLDDYPFRGPLARLPDTLRTWFQASLLPGALRNGLASLPVRWREEQDPYQNIDELLRALPRMAHGASLSEREALIKALYQLQASLDLDESQLDQLLEPSLAGLKGLRIGDRCVESVRRVRPGDHVDSESMWPLNPGSRVQQPLGVVLRDGAHKVIGLAKVACGGARV